MRPKQLVAWCVGMALLVGGAELSARERQRQAAMPAVQGSLRVVVQDQSGAIIPGALVQVRGQDDVTREISLVDLASDRQGVATATGLTPGRYTIEAAFPGFEKRVVTDVRVRAGDNRREVTLAIQKLDESVSVGRDAASAAADPNSDRFSTVLSKAQIDALPDDPDEMEKVLKEMAGPGATIRVDGFHGGKLPPKSQIRSIRFSQNMMAAENHGGGMVFVDIVTQPGLGPLRGGVDLMFRDDSLNARNAFQPSKGPEQTQQYTFNLSGTLWKERTSFSLSFGGASLYDSANIYARTPDGSRPSPIRRPADRLNVNGRLDHAVSKAHTLRATVQQNANDQRNLGVGNFDLSGREFSRNTEDTLVRLSESGPWTRTLFGETRAQIRRTATSTVSASELQTLRVLDAFTSGGAQQSGGRGTTEIEWATNVDWARARHSIRAGALVEGGWFSGDSRTNYLGTYTFTSFADFEAGRPSTYTRRIGDPRVEYTHWQAGIFIQDDWRALKNLTISAGLRQEIQTPLGDSRNLAPRFGFTWSPFKSGRTTVRGGGGVFHDWLDSETYEQTLRVDGVRQQDLVIRNPGYPDPFSGGASQQILPASKYVLAGDLVMPSRTLLNLGVSQQLTPTLSANVNFMHSEGSNRLRGRNINAPQSGGLRPDAEFGSITQVESTARMRGDQLNGGLNLNIPNRRTFLFVNYALIRQNNDADGPFSLPADSYDLAGEWGAAAGLPRHTFSGVLNTTLPKNLRLGLSAAARTGTPYNVTSGRDDNGDTIFNDRPEGLGRNSANGKGMWDIAARLSYAFGFGERPPPGAGGSPGHTMIIRSAGGGAGDMLGALGGGGAENKRIRFEVFVSATNLFNNVNPVGYSGVMTAPFFGQPTASMPSRRIDLGMKVGF